MNKSKLQKEFQRVSKRIKDAKANLAPQPEIAQQDFDSLCALFDQQAVYHGNLHTDALCTSFYIGRLATTLGYRPATAHIIKEAALLHNISRSQKPDFPLSSSNKQELRQMMNNIRNRILTTHIDSAHIILDASEGPLGILAAELALYNGEKTDGTGTHKIKSEDLPRYNRMINICSFFALLTGDSAAVPPHTPAQALELMKNKCTGFDTEILEAFTEIAEQAFDQKPTPEKYHKRRSAPRWVQPAP